MSPTLDAFLTSWPSSPWLIVSLITSLILYARGWRVLRRRNPRRWSAGHLSAFAGGLLAILLALGSPIELFAELLLQVHMVQHMLLMVVAPPLIWLAAPQLPVLRGLPRPLRVVWVAPLLQVHWLRELFRFLTHPIVSGVLFALATWTWHVPTMYELALRSAGWHYVQHVCFVGSGLLFWYGVVRPYPSQPTWSLWMLLPCLIMSDVSNTILSALLTFSDRVFYTHYEQVPRLWGVSALDDQAAAGVIMWVPGSLAYLAPLFWIGLRLLYGDGKKRDSSIFERLKGERRQRTLQKGRLALPMVAESNSKQREGEIDVLRVPLLGAFLKWRHARVALQAPLLLVAVALIYDGLRGPQVTPLNLAGVLPWIHWRGVLIVGLLLAGNVFCLACPFMLPRKLARKLARTILPTGFAWPRWLRSKWLAVALIGLFLWAYEVFALWDSPWLTAWIAVGYFALAFAIDGLFRGASFCKYVCPIGQFNFVLSLASPMEVAARDARVCNTQCDSKDCIRGRDGNPGCELNLFVPLKVGNLDCTTCLDCIHACPHDNVGLIAHTPTSTLWHDEPRSGVGRLSRRPDLAALVLLLTFGAFANAAGMIEPVLSWQYKFGLRLGLSTLVMTTAFYVLSLIVLPVMVVTGAAWVSRWGTANTNMVRLATHFAFALVPLAVSMWAAHYLFHFVTSYDVIVPASQRFAVDAGWLQGEASTWMYDCCQPTAPWLLRFEIVLLDLGLIGSMYAGYRIASLYAETAVGRMAVLWPWLTLMIGLFAVGVWILLQPMQMRGVM